MEIKFKKLDPNALLPVYKTKGAVGADLSALNSTTIHPNELCLLRTGIAIEIPTGYFALLAPRSSICLKNDLIMPHSVGIFDEDYRGEYFIPLKNIGDKDIFIKEFERIAQIIFMPYVKAQFIETDELEETERNTGGFGSTGL